eukprot:scaffold33238_cov129-Isochrysis_galbana.AAC.4
MPTNSGKPSSQATCPRLVGANGADKAERPVSHAALAGTGAATVDADLRDEEGRGGDVEGGTRCDRAAGRTALG